MVDGVENEEAVGGTEVEERKERPADVSAGRRQTKPTRKGAVLNGRVVDSHGGEVEKA